MQPIDVYLQRILMATHPSQQYCLGLEEPWDPRMVSPCGSVGRELDHLQMVEAQTIDPSDKSLLYR